MKKIKNISKKTKIILAVILLVYIGFVVFAPLTRTMWLHGGTATFEDNANQKLSAMDEFIIKVVLNHKIIYEDSPSCGFSDSVSVSFNNGEEQFWFACDECATVYDKKEDKYFTVLPWDKEILHSVLAKYGFEFPCV